jgi:hypothetical protein
MNLVFFILLAMEAGCGQLQHCSLCHLPKAAYTSSTLWIIEPSRDVHVFLAFSEWALNSFSMDCHRDLGKMWETNKNTLFQFSTYFHPLQTKTHSSNSQPISIPCKQHIEMFALSYLQLTYLPMKVWKTFAIPNYYLACHFKNQFIIKYLINFQKLNFQYPFLCYFWIQ